MQLLSAKLEICSVFLSGELELDVKLDDLESLGGIHDEV